MTDVPEVACPSCGATIRARLMDLPGALTGRSAPGGEPITLDRGNLEHLADRLDAVAQPPDEGFWLGYAVVVDAIRKAAKVMPSGTLVPADDPRLRGPRVWLPGDTVPAGVWTVTEFARPYAVARKLADDAAPRVELLAPADFAAAVAAEQSRRATTDGEVTE